MTGSITTERFDMTDAVDTTNETAPRRGRPRPDVTIQRDEEVLTKLTEGAKTREELVAATGLGKNQVYLSLHRLRKTNRVERVRDGAKHVWSAVTDA